MKIIRLRNLSESQKEYSIHSFIKNMVSSKDYLERKLRQLSDSKLLQRFRSIFPKSYNYLKSLKSKIKL